MASQRRAGFLQFQVDGEVQECQGEFEYNVGSPQKTAILGSDGKVHGFTEEAQVPFISGIITDRGNLKVGQLTRMDGVTCSLELANGKMVVLRDAWYAGDGNVNTTQAQIPVRFEGKSAREIT